MNLIKLARLIEKLRKEAIGEPVCLYDKGVFEYQEQSAKVVAVLKLVRAMHGVTAVNLLIRAGLFIDAGTLLRCINDCANEVYFLLEHFPDTSNTADQFIKEFFGSTIDGYLVDEVHQVPTKKIRSAVVRVLKGTHDDITRKLLERIFKTFSGYVHGSYVNVMEVYNGGDLDFNLNGVPSTERRNMWMQHADLSATTVLHAAAFLAVSLGLTERSLEIMDLEAS